MKETNKGRVTIFELEEKVKEKYEEEMSILKTNFVHDVIKIADKYNVDRDNAFNVSVQVLTILGLTSTFKDYDVESKNDE